MTPTDDVTQTRPGGTDPLDDPRVLAALEEYAAALRAGERPDREAFLARTPDIAAAVAECLDGLEFVCDAAPDLSGPAMAPAPGLEPAQPIGDFRIVREVGRGGMGVVYEAVQLSLGRRVALKVLPFAAAMDGRHLQRFRTEAQAAALLHHTNIVPVFAVGSDRGVHYYAMQFIDGRNLAAVVKELRELSGLDEPGGGRPSPSAVGVLTGRWEAADTAVSAPPGTATPAGRTTGGSARTATFFRTAASLAAQVADALAYAHAQGVVHRDVKPANLLIDAHGTPWVTDFGLARLHADAGLTATGDLLGTLRYMSPEQASGHREPVDHRTDVYSLGVTLYELLTLRPAFDGSDRAELLRRIATEDPPPPRRFNPAIPADLETVVLKAMAKSPADRYPTADALAADLRRYLEDRPIQARRPTAVQRARKWARRHRGLVWAAAAAAGVSLAGSFAFVWHAHHQALAAYRNEAGERIRAERERDRAERNLGMALDALDKAFMEVAETYFPVDKARSPAYRELVRHALGVYQKLAEENRDWPKMRDEAARAYRRAGVIYMKVNELAEAEAPLRQSVALSRQAVADYPGDQRYLHSLGVCLFHLAQWCDAVRRKPEAEQLLRETVAIRERLTAEHPGDAMYRSALAVSYSALGELLAELGREADAEAALRKALAVMDRIEAEFPAEAEEAFFHSRRATALQALGKLLRRQRRDAEAEDVLRAVLAIRETWLADAPTATVRMANAAKAAFALAALLTDLGRTDDAEPVVRRSISLYADLAARHPTVAVYADDLAAARRMLGRLLSRRKRFDEAEQEQREAVAVREKLVADAPGVTDYQVRLAHEHRGLGMLRFDAGRPADAAGPLRDAVAVWRRLAEKHPADPEFRHQAALCLRDAGRAARAAGRPADAEPHFRDAVATLEGLSPGDPPEPPTYRASLAEAHQYLGSVLIAVRKLDEADAAIGRAKALYDELTARFPDDLAYAHELATAYHNAADLAVLRGRPAEAEALIREAIRRREPLVARPDATASHRRVLAHDYQDLAAILSRGGRWADADAALRRSLEVNPANAAVLNDRARLLANCPEVALRRPAEAAGLAKSAVERAPKVAAYWQTLGVARLRSGDGPGAVLALERSVELGGGSGTVQDWLYLAMSHARAGDAAAARTWYEKAARRLAERPSDDPALARLRAEAAEQLGRAPTDGIPGGRGCVFEAPDWGQAGASGCGGWPGLSLRSPGLRLPRGFEDSAPATRNEAPDLCGRTVRVLPSPATGERPAVSHRSHHTPAARRPAGRTRPWRRSCAGSADAARTS